MWFSGALQKATVCSIKISLLKNWYYLLFYMPSLWQCKSFFIFYVQCQAHNRCLINVCQQIHEVLTVSDLCVFCFTEMKISCSFKFCYQSVLWFINELEIQYSKHSAKLIGAPLRMLLQNKYVKCALKAERSLSGGEQSSYWGKFMKLLSPSPLPNSLSSSNTDKEQPQYCSDSLVKVAECICCMPWQSYMIY